MDALKIAFETIIVGALALPWVTLLVDLFCPAKRNQIGSFFTNGNDQTRSAVAGVVLFALAYLLGSSIARISEDFFNDDDFPVFVTEDSIRSTVYCNPNEPWIIQTGLQLTDNQGSMTDGLALCPSKTDAGSTVTTEVCTASNKDGKTSTERLCCKKEKKEKQNDELAAKVRQLFAVQESKLLLSASPDRIRYLHQQLVVLRGITLDAIIVFVLSLFGFCGRRHRWGRITLSVLALVMLGAGLYTLHKHLCEHWQELSNMAVAPPLMEGVVIALALAGLYLAWRGVSYGNYGAPTIFAALLTLLAFSGWWSTEILYDQTIIYFYYAGTGTGTLIH